MVIKTRLWWNNKTVFSVYSVIPSPSAFIGFLFKQKRDKPWRSRRTQQLALYRQGLKFAPVALLNGFLMTNGCLL